MLTGASPGSLALVHKSGWMTSENFLQVLNHPVLLIMDNESHFSVEALDFAKENGIVVLTLPPHTSNKLQPLDKTVVGPFKKFVASGIDSWLLENPNQVVGIFALPRICSLAWDRAASSQNIKSGFCATGISPFDPDIFKDIDFMSSFVSDRETHPVASTSAADALTPPAWLQSARLLSCGRDFKRCHFNST
ncbi:hypothetical protein ILUMI_18559 [Ignelater luminosus]|uniref:DDE-1 domain-containing protein n=1 Tax=Ignelater luminosus TaxID=2038154 RepID=A0A8K0CJP1_IGNLU|nr:hypothetical protein ILUMI_18559 [Ignelater luminosus]